jgi:hypothetical protein
MILFLKITYHFDLAIVIFLLQFRLKNRFFILSDLLIEKNMFF